MKRAFNRSSTHSDRTIIFFDLVNFPVSVERSIDPGLVGIPVIIAPPGGHRARVIDMSGEAYREGVRKKMSLAAALSICKNAVVLPFREEKCEKAMASLCREMSVFTPLVEHGESDGHFFLDVTGTKRLFGSPENIAKRIHHRIREEFPFHPVWAIASNKLTARAAARTVKPSGKCVVPTGSERQFLSSIPLGFIPGILQGEIELLKGFNIITAGQAAGIGEKRLRLVFGKRAAFIYDAVRGIDATPIFPSESKKPGIRVDHEFGEDTNRISVMESALYQMVERAGVQLRSKNLSTGRIIVILFFSDGRNCSRMRTMRPGVYHDHDLFQFASSAARLAWYRRLRIRHIRLVLDRLTFTQTQLELFPDRDAVSVKKETLEKTIDQIRRKFGWRSVVSGRTFVKTYV